MQIWIVTMAIALVASGAQAANLNVNGGILQGASGVEVAGELYNVDFRDGTCEGLFNGCDSADDFVFPTLAEAQAASQALGSQVFAPFNLSLTTFDSTLTNGCGSNPLTDQCVALTPVFDYPSLTLGPYVGTSSWSNAFDFQAGEPGGVDDQFLRQNFDFLRFFTRPTGLAGDTTGDFAQWILCDGGGHPLIPEVCTSYADVEPTWAVWTPIPEPSSVALLALGLVALSSRRVFELRAH